MQASALCYVYEAIKIYPHGRYYAFRLDTAYTFGFTDYLAICRVGYSHDVHRI